MIILNGGLQTVKRRFRPVAGYLLHRVRFYNWRYARSSRHSSAVVERLWAYLEVYYRSCQSVCGPLVIDADRTIVYCDINDWIVIDYALARSPLWESAHIMHAASRCQPGDHVVDIGANHGTWGVSLATNIGRMGRAYLIEANPEMCRRLAMTVKWNPNLDLRLLPYAAGDGTAKYVEFYLPAERVSGAGSTVLHEYGVEHEFISQDRSTWVPACSIDGLVSEGIIQAMDILKIDVEFGEDAVIAGAADSIRRFRPRLVVCETSPSSAAFQTLINMGYRPYLVDDDDSNLTLDVSATFWGNIFFSLDDPRSSGDVSW